MPAPLTKPVSDIALAWLSEADHPKAMALSRDLHLPLLTEAPHALFRLQFNSGRLELCENNGHGPGPICVDFTGGRAEYRRLHGGGRKQPLARAVGLKKNRCPHILDATAGLGRDAFVLASLGCTVHLLERSPILHALLADGLRRGSHDEKIKDIINRMTLRKSDARQAGSLLPGPDVIYLDPMYPHRSKSSLVKKELRLIRRLVGDDKDADDLLTWAFSCCPARVVVKRPKGAPFLGNKKPPLTINSKNSRFDIYFPIC